jgi:hypothetical protein
MRYLLVAILGLVLGAAAAGVVLYFNPLSVSAAPPPSASDRVLHYTLPDDVLEFAVGDEARLLGQDPGDDSLWEETIDRTAVLGLVLKDDSDQPAALATRLLSTSAESDLLLRGVVVTDHWLVTVPAEGTLFVHADSNAWPFLKERLLPVWYFEQPWEGPAEYWPTIGPGADETGDVVGVAGSFRGSTGSAVERYEITTLDRAGNRAFADGEIHLRLPGPQVAAQ